MVEHAHANRRISRGVGQNEVELVRGKAQQKLFGRVFIALYLDAAPQGKSRLQNAVSDQLRNKVGDADDQAQRAITGTPLENISQLASEGEDLVGIAVDGVSGVRQH